jgi:MFS transporter, MHS family, proline/betaine transporter
MLTAQTPLSWPLLWMMHHPETWIILLGQLGFAALIACFAGACPAA